VILWGVMTHMKIICLSSIVIKQELLLLSYWPSVVVFQSCRAPYIGALMGIIMHPKHNLVDLFYGFIH